MKMKNEKLNIIILIIKNLLPMSSRKVRQDNGLMLELLHAQTELMLLNRHDIMALSANMQTPSKRNAAPESKTDNLKNMYG